MSLIKHATIVLAALFTISATTPQSATTSPIIIIDGQSISRVDITAAETSTATAASVFALAGTPLSTEDAVFVNGIETSANSPVTVGDVIQSRRAITVSIISEGNKQTLTTNATTVAKALGEAGIELYTSDFIDPVPSTPLMDSMVITHRPARILTVNTGEQQITIRSSAETVGKALAQGGLALTGLDYSLPGENETVPNDGQIKIVQVSESLVLLQKSLPFSSEFQASAELEIDQQDLLQKGELGLAMSRVRVRYEDGVEVSRQVEDEAVVRPAKNRIVGYGTKIVVRTTTVDGIQIEYWRVKQMYATSYSPCRSAASRCFSYTSSGKPVVRGVVAMRRAYYLAMQGQPIYIPGYGYATIEDVGGGIPDGRLWVDLGFSDSDYTNAYDGWNTVYFLTPVPNSVVWVLE